MAETLSAVAIGQILNRDRNELHRQARELIKDAGALAHAFHVMHMDGMAKRKDSVQLEAMLHKNRDIIGIRLDKKMDDAMVKWREMREMDLKMKKLGIKLTLPQSDDEAMR